MHTENNVKPKYHFEEVSLLITHYNRSSSLERLLVAFKNLDISFGGIVVSDDCSNPVHFEKLEQLKEQWGYQLIASAENKGLGNNINKGQDAVLTPLTLYVQEDFVPKTIFPIHFKDAVRLMKEREDVDIIRFYSYFMYPSLKPYKKGFSEMFFNRWLPDHWKFNFYSDHPHLRRRNFMERFGRYAEGIASDKTEFAMCLSVIKNRGKGLFYTGIYNLFDHMNSPEEPSTVNRSNWRQSKNPGILFIRAVYLQLKLIKNTIQLAKFPEQHE